MFKVMLINISLIKLFSYLYGTKNKRLQIYFLRKVYENFIVKVGEV